MKLMMVGRITSLFGNRTVPVPGASKFHNGIDIAAREGNLIVSPESGLVTRNEFDGTLGGGYWVEVKAEKYAYRFFHLKAKSALEVGTKVNEGFPVGFCGHTGRGSGDHLHFEVLENGKKIDPFSIPELAEILKKLKFDVNDPLQQAQLKKLTS